VASKSSKTNRQHRSSASRRKIKIAPVGSLYGLLSINAQHGVGSIIAALTS